ncbi:MAG: hypothetical protein IIA07_02430 [Proteobacteria bacterium]|nr:hypothetical protein [Pseudomonadota bacterium]
MFKSFIAGIFIGISLGAAALYYVPAVDQHREQSMIEVKPNGGNTESFHINVPMDRIMIGAPNQQVALPPGLEWPSDNLLAGIRAELFKIRNVKNIVVGVASRIAADDSERGDVIEWVLHLPARGSVYLTMQPEAVVGGYRVGELRAGTREFSSLQGQVTERWIADTTASDNPTAGRIELKTEFVGLVEDQ